MKRVSFFATLLVLGACSEKAEQTYTVDELIADGALLAHIMSECRNNPGELHDTVDCRNAEAADGKLRLQNMRKALGK
ncbi:EexN family lipoprotein [Shinella sumterensis]|uniref:EexN family lipoprotein n=1 Tax=Shinella sumterensis TaxID=1967501 RepID=A0AA50CRN0_9HYPH|nr:EexN family lipoprotein [Shinella sumterensis]WLS00691.1 EexN family lipoprotein [Shinella sumterensis]